MSGHARACGRSWGVRFFHRFFPFFPRFFVIFPPFFGQALRMHRLLGSTSYAEITAALIEYEGFDEGEAARMWEVQILAGI